MSSNRLKYDDSAYDAQVKQSVDPMSHLLSGYYGLNCNTCLPEPSVVGPSNPRQLDNNLIDVENVLTNRDWKMDKKQFNNNRVDQFLPTVNKLNNSLTLRSCMNGELTSTHSTITNPRVNYKGLSQQHLIFYGTPINHQDVAPLSRNPGFMSSRDIAIDQYKVNLRRDQTLDRKTVDKIIKNSVY